MYELVEQYMFADCTVYGEIYSGVEVQLISMGCHLKLQFLGNHKFN